MRYLVTVEYTDMAARERALSAHRAYLARAREEGTVVESGPFADGKGGMYILSVADDAAAQAFIDADPYRKDAGLPLTLRRFASSNER
jgi:uncharacterized protein